VNPKDLPRIFSYAFTTASGLTSGGLGSEEDDGMMGGPYAAQAVGGLAGIAHGGDSGVSDSGAGLFSEIVGKGVQTGLGTIAGLGYG
jgi:26S proteasome regulatory subunit T1